MKIEENGFKKYDIEETIVEALTLLGYQEPTPVQKAVIPYILEGRDVAAKSQTGSGKTAAFAIPILSEIVWEENLPQALVLEPTRELAVQVKEEIARIGRIKRMKVPVVFGGMPVDKQVRSLKQKAHVAVGTPGRVLDHLRRESLKLSKIKYLVIDEADLMLDMGFLEDVKQIIESVPKKPVTLLFSATFGEHLDALIAEYMEQPQLIVLESKTQTADQVEQIGFCVENEDKLEAMLTIFSQEMPENCMIFCGTREMVNVLYRQMKKVGIRCGMLHGAMEQRERLQTIEGFREGRFHYLITTDVASRGIDFERISHVVNYDFPTGKESYVHRIGRTGRNGNSGKAISFIQASEKRMQKAVEEFSGVRITMRELPKKEEVSELRKEFMKKQKTRSPLRERRGAVFNKTIMKLSIGGGKKSKLRVGDIVGAICTIEGVMEGDIGIIDVRDSLTYVEILNGKGDLVLTALQDKTIKGKIRKVRKNTR